MCSILAGVEDAILVVYEKNGPQLHVWQIFLEPETRLTPISVHYEMFCVFVLLDNISVHCDSYVFL